MPLENDTGKYIVSSPVKDVERHSEITIHAALSGTIRPSRRVIVDGGSQDSTPDILRGTV